MDSLRKIIEPSLESAIADIGVTGDFWKKALGVSREKHKEIYRCLVSLR